MPYYDDSTKRMITDHLLGLRVDRAASLIPAHGGVDDVDYFTIYDGPVLMTLLYGEITVAVAAAANEIIISHNPTPSAGATAALNAALDISGWAEGDILTIDGLLTNAMLPAASAGSSYTMSYGGVILSPGSLNFGNSGASVANWKWSMFYFPLTEGAYVAAV